MITYSVVIEPCEGGFRASCPAVGVQSEAASRVDALAMLPGHLTAALVAMYMTGKPMPHCEMMERGELSISPAFYWNGTKPD